MVEPWRDAAGFARPGFSDRCYAECTRDVIFLLRRKVYSLHAVPAGYVYDGDLEAIVKEDDRESRLSMKELSEMESPTGYGYCASWHWEIDSHTVWLSRQEAEAFAKRTAYNFSNGWQVYGVCSNGELAELIKET